MFDTLILLTLKFQQPILANILRTHRPRLDVLCAESLTELEAIGPERLARARLIAFTTSVIVPDEILNALGFRAYNFHPGSPSYPGWAPAPFAIYDRARSFGATAHEMVEEVDAGPIVGADLFDIPPGTTVEGLETLAFSRLALLYRRLAGPLATSAEPLPQLPVRWSGRKSTRRMCASACEIPVDISADELTRRVAAFGSLAVGISPTITLHGFQFRIAS